MLKFAKKSSILNNKNYMRQDIPADQEAAMKKLAIQQEIQA